MAEDELRDTRDTPAGALGTPGSISASDRFGLLGRSTLLRNGLLAVAGIFISWLLVTSLSSGTDQQLQQIPAYACAAIGLTLLVGFSGQISLGHGAFMMIGGYTFALLWPKWQGHPNLTIAGALAAALVVSALAGGIVGIAGARLRGPYLAGATLALAVGLPSLTQYEKLSKHLKGSEGLSIPSPPTPHGFDFIQWPLFVGLVCMVILLFFTANLSRSRIGREMRAVRDDEIAASLAGLSVPRVQVLEQSL